MPPPISAAASTVVSGYSCTLRATYSPACDAGSIAFSASTCTDLGRVCSTGSPPILDVVAGLCSLMEGLLCQLERYHKKVTHGSVPPVGYDDPLSRHPKSAAQPAWLEQVRRLDRRARP